MPIRLNKKHGQRGFTVIEAMIGIAIAGLALATALTLFTKGDDQSVGRVKAEEIVSFQTLASQYFIANRADYEAALGGDAAKAALLCRLNVATDGSGGTVSTNPAKHTCAFDATLLRAKGLWPSASAVDLYGGRYVAILRQVMSTDAVPVPTGGEEMLIVFAPVSNGNVMTSGSVSFNGDPKRAAAELKAGMDTLGASGGMIPPGADYGTCQYNGTTKQVCGKTWAVNLDDFIN
jgi:prepilin-type N-terminal cleavage/methylation domain-containing protein